MLSRKERGRKLRRQKARRAFIFTVTLLLFIGGFLLFIYLKSDEDKHRVEENNSDLSESLTRPEVKEEPKADVETTIVISAAGDFTLGTDESFGYEGTFVHEADKKGLEHFVGGLGDVFKNDDLTTVNLETTLTKATKKAEKKFRFKGDSSYAHILTLGGIEAVNLANNHTYDYLEQGYLDTMAALDKENIDYFGYDDKYVTTIKEVKIGALGYEGWNDSTEIRSQIAEDVEELREQGVQIILVHFHWGNESEYVPTASQKSLGHYTIDAGADLVVGHHPHVVQGIEEYNGKFIVYSLGNFMFGGNRNPSDKDTFAFQQTFHFLNGELTEKKDIHVIPFSISSQKDRNDYRPTLLEGAERERVKKKIIDLSNQISGSQWLEYEEATK